jgi:aspartyl-tRNA(Asn)/glutamyl-tRNA(Gln) amidotransferase subunit A
LPTHRRLGWWPARAGEYGADVRARLELAAHTDPGHYVDAQARRADLRAALARLLTEVDLVLSPVSTEGPCLVGRSDPDYREQVMTYTAPQSLAGLPALTLPAGFDPDGLPVGVQLTGRPWSEPHLLDLAARLADARLADAERDRWPNPAHAATESGPPTPKEGASHVVHRR